MRRQQILITGLPNHQRGITLIVALIFLGVLALLGITAAQVMSLEERMAGNARNKDLAFQAAEAALNAAQADIYSGAMPVSVASFPGNIKTPGSGGMYQFDLCNPNGRDFWNGSTAMKNCTGASVGPFDWSAAGAAKTPTVSLSDGIKEQPKYIVEWMPPLAGATARYRVTARGVGGDDNAVVILQAIYQY